MFVCARGPPVCIKARASRPVHVISMALTRPGASLPPELWAHIGSYLPWDALRALIKAPLAARDDDGAMCTAVVCGISIAAAALRRLEIRSARRIWSWYMMRRGVRGRIGYVHAHGLYVYIGR